MREGFITYRLVTVWLCGLALATAAVDTQAATLSEDTPARSAESRPRIALVIGNSQYKKLSPLPTTHNDAEDVADALKKLGFEVMTAFEADLNTMHEALGKFSDALKIDRNRNALAAFYFAGYGLQRGGSNFVLPINFDVNQDGAKLDQAAIGLNSQIIMAMISGRTPGSHLAGSNVIILDACRDDPFGQRPGLARIDVPSGTLIAFAAAAGQQVIDTLDLKAPARNSIYTKQLLRKLNEPSPNIDLEKLFKIVKHNVSEVSNGLQDPLVMSNLNPLETVSLAPENTQIRASDEELKLWKTIEKSPDLCDFEEFYKRYPKSEFAESVLATMDQIKKKITITEEAYANLDEDLREKALKSFRDKRAQSNTRCAAKWQNKTTDLKIFLARYPNHGYRGERFTANPHTMIAQWQDPPPKYSIGFTLPWSDSAETEDKEFQANMITAEQGDVDAMYRVALKYEEGTHSVHKNTEEMLRWLVLSSTLGNGLASYKLYRYYAEQPTGYAKAVKFKSLANKQGYYGPVGLSSRR